MSELSTSRRTTLLQAALTCFAQHGVEATTIAMLREATGASTGSLYHHFGSKEGVVEALYLEGLRDFRRLQADYLARASGLQDGVRALVHAQVDWITAHPHWADFLFRQRPQLAGRAAETQLLAEQAASARALMDWFTAYGPRRWPLSVEIALVIGPVHEYARHWLAGRVTEPLSVWREVFAEAALGALGLPPGGS